MEGGGGRGGPAVLRDTISAVPFIALDCLYQAGPSEHENHASLPLRPHRPAATSASPLSLHLVLDPAFSLSLPLSLFSHAHTHTHTYTHTHTHIYTHACARTHTRTHRDRDKDWARQRDGEAEIERQTDRTRLMYSHKLALRCTEEKPLEIEHLAFFREYYMPLVSMSVQHLSWYWRSVRAHLYSAQHNDRKYQLNVAGASINHDCLHTPPRERVDIITYCGTDRHESVFVTSSLDQL